MDSNLTRAWHAAARAVDRTFDAFSARPLGIAVFVGSVVLLVHLQTGLASSIRTDAVAYAVGVEHASRVDSFVEKTFVRPGDVVEAGAPLIELSAHFIERDLARLDARIARQIEEAKLGRAELMVDEQRWLDERLRRRPDRPSLESPMEALQATELAELQVRRDQLVADLETLTIKAARAGRVDFVAAPGAAVAEGSSVASVTPEFADEIVAFLPAYETPGKIAAGAPVRITRSAQSCGDETFVLRRGARVEQAPGQLRTLFRFPVHGLPIYIAVPDRCHFAVGQVLTVEFLRRDDDPLG